MLSIEPKYLTQLSHCFEYFCILYLTWFLLWGSCAISVRVCVCVCMHLQFTCTSFAHTLNKQFCVLMVC